MQVICSCSADELTSFVKSNISAKSQVTTNGCGAYNNLQNEGYSHKAIVQSKIEDKESVLPGVHLIASLAKRIMLGTFQGRFDARYLQCFIDVYPSILIGAAADLLANDFGESCNKLLSQLLSH
jgi:hypothetical protein